MPANRGRFTPFDANIHQKVFAYDTGGNLIYEGWAAPGAASTEAAWAIRKLTYNGSSQVTAETWAAGGSDETHIWDNRASLSYS